MTQQELEKIILRLKKGKTPKEIENHIFDFKMPSVESGTLHGHVICRYDRILLQYFYTYLTIRFVGTEMMKYNYSRSFMITEESAMNYLTIRIK